MSEVRERIEQGDLSFLDGVGLLGALASQRWFGAKSRDVLDARVVAAAAAPGGPPLLAVAVVEVRFSLQTHELYQLALGFRPAAEGWHESVVAEVGGWTAYDALSDPQLARELVGLMRRGASLALPEATIGFRAFGDANAGAGELGGVRPMGVEQSNSSVVLDERLVLKLYRRLERARTPSWSCCASSPSTASRTSPCSRGGASSRAGRWTRRSRSSSASCARAATAGRSRSTRSSPRRAGSRRAAGGSAR
jgi:hypothetical protein